MNSVAEDSVIRLRTGLLKHAVRRVRAMVADGQVCDANMAAAELQRYGRIALP